MEDFETPPEESSSFDDAPARSTEWRDWAIFGLAVLNTVLLLLMLWKSPPQREVVPPTQTAPATTTTAAPTDTTAEGTRAATTTAVELQPEVVGVALHSALRRLRTGVTYSTAITTWLNDTSPPTTGTDVARARVAALQFYFQKNGCGTGTIDGATGPGFWSSIHCLARNNDSFDVVKDDQKLIDWLQGQ